MNKKATLFRLMDNGSQTLGILSTINGGQLFVAKTLELPNKGNQRKISCIPAGIYRCVWAYSPAFKKHTYRLLDVPDRDGILMHAANYFKQLLGCIALGSALKDINNDGHQDIIHSGNTMEEFEKIMNEEEFELRIIEHKELIA